MGKTKLLLLLLALLSLALGDTCGGANCPTGKCPTCYCGRSTNLVDVSEWCSRYTWNQACCKCIVEYESGGNANALNYNNNGTTWVGLWQINTVYWGSCNQGQPPCDPEENLKCAIEMYKEGKSSWGAWKTRFACGC